MALVAASLGAANAPRAGEGEPVDEIVVHKERKRPVEIFGNSPVETQILTTEELRQIPATDVAAAVSKLPGIQTQQRVQGEEAAVSIEGMPVAYTKILVDGQQYSGEIGGIGDLRDISLANVDRIEILRGSQGLRYGPDAAGGVINIITDSPEENVEFDFDFAGGADTKAVGNSTLGFALRDFSTHVTIDHDQIDGFDPPDGEDGVLTSVGGKDSRRRSRDVYATTDYTGIEDFTLRSRIGWRREDEDFVPVDGGSTLNRQSERWLANPGFDWYVGETSRAAGDFDYYNNRIVSSVGRQVEIEEDQYQLRFLFDHFFDWDWVGTHFGMGAELRHPTLELREGPLPSNIQNENLTAQDQQEHFDVGGLWLNGESALFSWTTLFFGARAESHSEFGSVFLPQVALELQPLDSLKFRASWGRNHRTPSLRDLYQPAVPQQGGSYFLKGNPSLTPESSTSWRLGLEFSPRPWIALSATAFKNNIRDHIRSDSAGSVVTGTNTVLASEALCRSFGLCDTVESPVTASLFEKTNLDAVETRGIEAQLRLEWARYAELNLGYTLLDTQVIDSGSVDVAELPNSPRHTLDARFAFTLPHIETTLSGQARWRDRSLAENSGTGTLGFTTDRLSDPSLVVDLRVSQPIGERFTAYFDVNNVTNERVVDSYAVRGRTYTLGLRGHFDWRLGGGS